MTLPGKLEMMKTAATAAAQEAGALGRVPGGQVGAVTEIP